MITKTPDIVEVLEKAADALAESERLRVATRVNDAFLTRLCREYDAMERTTGIQPHHLRNACAMRGIAIGL